MVARQIISSGQAYLATYSFHGVFTLSDDNIQIILSASYLQ